MIALVLLFCCGVLVGSLFVSVVSFGFTVLVACVFVHLHFVMSGYISEDCCPYTCVLFWGVFLLGLL